MPERSSHLTHATHSPILELMKTKVAIVKCPDYSPDTVSAAVREAVGLLGGFGEFVRPGDSVFVKPNLLSPRSPDMAVTTHPAVLEAVLAEVIEAGGQVKVGDSPPLKGETAQAYDRLCEITGTLDVCRRLNVPIVRLEESVVEIDVDQAKLYKKFQVSKEILDSTSWISVAKLKTHALTTLTCAVKNIFGCVPGRKKAMFHAQACTDVEHFCEMLVDLMSAIPPKLTVVDAVVAMEGEGPNAGTPKSVGVIVAGTDPVAVDAVCSRLIGIDPMSVHTTRLAHSRGLGCADMDEIEILGASLDDVAVSDFKLPTGGDMWTKMPPFIRRFARTQLVAAPHIASQRCKNCLDCLKACPVDAIKGGEKRPVLDLDPCIRCYCCHEVCTYGAIDLKKGWLGRLLNK